MIRRPTTIAVSRALGRRPASLVLPSFRANVLAPIPPGNAWRQMRLFSSQPYPQEHEFSSAPNYSNQRRDDIFGQHSAAYVYRDKSTTELVRAYISLSLCQLPWLVRNAETLLEVSDAVLGKKATEMLLKHTMFGHFCVGESETAFLPKLEHMKKLGIGTMLDYAVEGANHNNNMKNTLEEQDAAIETVCDRNNASFCKSLESAALLGRDHGTVAICVTAIGNPRVLEKFTTVLNEWQALFERESDSDQTMSAASLQSLLKTLYANDKLKQQKLLERMIDPTSGRVDLIRWTSLVQPKDFLGIQASDHTLLTTLMDEQEVKLLEACHRRGHKLAQKASDTGSPLYIDAEQVRYQRAIDHLVWTLQQEYNNKVSTDRPVVINTYQCYLKDATTRLKRDVERAERFQYAFAAKLVRGAYMQSERALAAESGQASPIHNTIADTHTCYNQNVDFLLEYASSHPGSKMEVFVATHNEDSILRTIAAMDKHRINRKDTTVLFGQLYGMADHLTVALAANNYRSYKYSAFGSINDAIPYLIRRAIENNSLSSGAKNEIGMIGRELRKRLVGF